MALPGAADRGAIRHQTGRLRRATCGRGPLSMANSDTTSGILVSAGFAEISLRRCDPPFKGGDDGEEAVDLTMDLGPAGEFRTAGRSPSRADPTGTARRDGGVRHSRRSVRAGVDPDRDGARARIGAVGRNVGRAAATAPVLSVRGEAPCSPSCPIPSSRRAIARCGHRATIRRWSIPSSYRWAHGSSRPAVSTPGCASSTSRPEPATRRSRRPAVGPTSSPAT